MKNLTIVVVGILVMFTLLGLGRQIVAAINAGQRLEKSAGEVEMLKQENRLLKDKLAQVDQADYTEEIARDKLNLGKPGETVVVVPDQAIEKVLSLQQPAKATPIPNWQGWLKLFF